jgi:hypothetical protein
VTEEVTSFRTPIGRLIVDAPTKAFSIYKTTTRGEPWIIEA